MTFSGAIAIRRPGVGIPLRAFTRGLRISWMLIAAITILLEVVPIPLMRPMPFYVYCGAKVLLFAALGYLAPLAFWPFDVLNRGIILAAFSACCVETLQGLLQHGHAFHWYELIAKLALILLGFCFALNARYDRRIVFGPLRFYLLEEHE